MNAKQKQASLNCAASKSNPLSVHGNHRHAAEPRSPRILLLNFQGMGIGASALLAVDALRQNPRLDVRFIYEQRMAESPLQRTRLEKIPGFSLNTSRKHLPLAWLKILFFCLKFRPDIIHDLSGPAFKKMAPLWPAFSAIARLVITDHGPSRILPATFLSRVVRKTAYRCADKLIVFGPNSRAELAGCGVAETNIFQSRLGHKGFYADPTREPSPRDPNLILFFGEFRPSKGLDLIIPIAEVVHARFPEATFMVAGSSDAVRYCDESWQRKIAQLLAEMRARPGFKVVEQYIPDAEVAGYFERAGMVLIPYREANQSGVLLTAMGLGCPVVATAVGDIPSVIANGENGLLCAPDHVELAEAISSLLQDPGRAATLAAKAKRDAEKHFCWEDVVAEYPRKAYSL